MQGVSGFIRVGDVLALPAEFVEDFDEQAEEDDGVIGGGLQ